MVRAELDLAGLPEEDARYEELLARYDRAWDACEEEGERFVRLSFAGPEQDIVAAMRRMKSWLR